MRNTSVLHVWNTAGVASIIAKYQKKILGWRTWVITRKKYDPYGLTLYGEACSCGKYSFYLKTLVKSTGYHIIHVHSRDEYLRLKPLYRIMGKCVILHYHGSDIRGKWRSREGVWRKADRVIVATQDLYMEAVEEGYGSYVDYVPNPVDTEIFKPMAHILRKENTALFIYNPHNPKLAASLEWARMISEKHGLRLIIHNVSKRPMKYTEMPYLLNRYEYFIDHSYVKALSKTALEALACGAKVIRWDGSIVEGLPPEHRPENVIERISEIYEKYCR